MNSNRNTAMIHVRLTLLAILFSFHGVCQTLDEIEFLSDKELKTFIETQTKVCEVPDSGWINTKQSNIRNQWNTGISVIHFGSFDDYISLESILTLNDLQKQISQVKFFIVSDSKFGHRQKDYSDFINRYNIALPIFIEPDRVSNHCLNDLTAPLTLIVSPGRRIIHAYHGLPDAEKMATEISQLGSRLNALYEIKSQPFLGRSPHQFSKSHLIECPAGIAVDEENDRLFVSDFCGNKVIILSTDGSILDVIGTGTPGDRSGQAYNAILNGPRGLAYNNQRLYIADSRNNAIKMVDFTRSEIKRLETPELLIYPTGIHLTGNFLYITNPNAIWKMDLTTEFVELVAIHQNSPEMENGLFQPLGITTTEDGTLVFSESLSSSISYLENHQVTKSNLHPEQYGYKDGKKNAIA